MNVKDLVIAKLVGKVELRYKDYKFLIHDKDMYIEMIEPDNYEVGTLGFFNISKIRDITENHLKSWVADYYDIPNRDQPLSDEEKKEIKQNFSVKERVEILGMNKYQAEGLGR